jgi:hypothetical protein
MVEFTDERLASAVVSVVTGDIGELDIVAAASPQRLSAVAASADLQLTRNAVAAVLRRYCAGQLAPLQAQAWASFVRRGYVAGASGTGPIVPLQIEYELAYEDAIVEAIGRLDEIGDLIDGVVSIEEANSLLGALMRA